MSYEQHMRTLWPRSMKIWWFSRALRSLIHLSAPRNLSLKPWANQHMLTLKVIEGRWRSNRNLLTVACNCSRLVIIIDRRGYSSVNIVIGVFAVGFFFRRFDFPPLQQNLAIASSSNFLCLFSNSRRSADRTNKWPLRMTLMCDLDLSVL